MKTVILHHAWMLQSSHEFVRGVFDYVRGRCAWNIRQVASPDLMKEGLQSWEYDGAITALPPPLKARRGARVVYTALPAGSTRAAVVDFDPDAIGRMAAEYLRSRGAVGYAVVTADWPHGLRRRCRAFVEAMRGMGCEVVEIEPGGADVREKRLREAVAAVPRPAALFAPTDNLARECLETAREIGLHLPDEFAVLGCQNDLLVCEGITPAISSIELPFHRMGFETAQMLDAMMAGRGKAARTVHLPPTGVVERYSTSVLACEDPAVRKACNFIRKNLTEKLTLDRIAREAGVSLRILQHRYKKATGQTPVEAILHERCERAKVLLRTSHRQMEDIAEACGFPNANYFSKMFTRTVGVSPNKYRRGFKNT